jgi:hypothetical protein
MKVMFVYKTFTFMIEWFEGPCSVRYHHYGIQDKPASRQHISLIISTKSVTLVEAVMQKRVEFSEENKMQIISLKKRYPLETQGLAMVI